MPFQAPEEAIAAIQKRGGRVERDEKAAGKPVTTVNLATTGAGDEDLKPVEGMTTLVKLTLNNCKVTDAGLEKLKGLTSLKKLYLSIPRSRMQA